MSGQANVVYQSKQKEELICPQSRKCNDCRPQMSSIVTEKGWAKVGILGPWKWIIGFPLAI